MLADWFNQLQYYRHNMSGNVDRGIRPQPGCSNAEAGGEVAGHEGAAERQSKRKQAA